MINKTVSNYELITIKYNDYDYDLILANKEDRQAIEDLVLHARETYENEENEDDVSIFDYVADLLLESKLDLKFVNIEDNILEVF